MSISRKSNLVIVRAGRRSTHQTWLAGPEPDFDLHVIAYEELPETQTRGAQKYQVIPGPKVFGWGEYLTGYWEEVSRYDRIALIDDDVACSAAEINASFVLGGKYNLFVWQPSLTWDSYFSHAITLNNPLFTLRYVNFVEMMCPFFTRQSLAEVVPLFRLGIELGVDEMWCRLPHFTDRCAVVDAVSVRHTREVGKLRADQGFVGADGEYLSYLDRIRKQVGYRFEGPVSYAGVLRSGKRIRNRLMMAGLTLAPLRGFPRSVNKGWFVRPILNHSGRNLLTNPDLESVATGQLHAADRR